MSRTKIAISSRSRPFELRAGDGFGPLTTHSPRPSRPVAHSLCLGATTFWRSTAASIESSYPADSPLPATTGARVGPGIHSNSQ